MSIAHGSCSRALGNSRVCGGLWVGDHARGHQTGAAPSGVELISSFPLTGDTGQISLISLFFKSMYNMHVRVCIVTCMFVCVHA